MYVYIYVIYVHRYKKKIGKVEIVDRRGACAPSSITTRDRGFMLCSWLSFSFFISFFFFCWLGRGVLAVLGGKKTKNVKLFAVCFALSRFLVFAFEFQRDRRLSLIRLFAGYQRSVSDRVATLAAGPDRRRPDTRDNIVSRRLTVVAIGPDHRLQENS